ncbi:hypothetical protein [Sphingobacterium deserti]|uniref:Uncharacterized protein n=1 Tax=Sphingobacterium deserti TaxID=1229276 RepID=A0A0B8T3I2_9SPHI|nr:hypothetical protein [Sphingobacterium deserti]KGE13628.1 hypothetical protein DI53_2549 [Sphingobacterium deserti]
MKKDKSTKIEDRYWEGVSSLEEEKILKSQKDEPYFDGLNELSKEKMDLEFDSFMDMLEEPAKIVAKKPKYRNLLFFAYGAAAIALFVTGFFFLHDKEEKGDSYQQPQFSSVKIAPKLVEPQESEKREAPYYVAVDTKHTKEKKHTKHIATPETVTIQAEEPADDSFVIVNGKPVYDEEEAEQIVLASLKIMASNFQEGKHALEKVKYINVEL